VRPFVGAPDNHFCDVAVARDRQRFTGDGFVDSASPEVGFERSDISLTREVLGMTHGAIRATKKSGQCGVAAVVKVRPGAANEVQCRGVERLFAIGFVAALTL
jgi:hypothetical protein